MSTIAEKALSLTFIRRKSIFDHSSMTMIISTSLSFFELFLEIRLLPSSVPVGSQVPIELRFALYLIITTPRIVVILIEINILRLLSGLIGCFEGSLSYSYG